ncbi:MAG TPA: DUF4426 domain-containing protein [Gammaproteobacteria bacterium]
MVRSVSLGCSVTMMLMLLACSEAQQTAGSAGGEAEVLGATESSREFGDYVLHFNALTTDQLDPAIAAEHGIVRSPNRALLNISVLRNQEIGLATAVSAEISASARNLTGQLRTIPIQEIREGDAIYYIGETQVANAETLIFTVDATPESKTEPLTVRFQRQFFVDE